MDQAGLNLGEGGVRELQGFGSAAMAVAMLAAFALTFGGVRLALKPKDRMRGVLMIVAAAVLIGNVLIWTL
jgi:high-affinity Fe2+/Pb2+ permease